MVQPLPTYLHGGVAVVLDGRGESARGRYHPNADREQQAPYHLDRGAACIDKEQKNSLYRQRTERQFVQSC